MRKAAEAVKFDDGEIWYYQCCGTTDTLISCIYKNYKSLNSNRQTHTQNKCRCGEGEEVKIYTSYGGEGSYFPGYSCRDCKSIRAKRKEVDYPNILGGTSGKPDWYGDIEWE